MTDGRNLERDLRELARHTTFPPTPEVPQTLLDRIHESPARGESGERPRRRFPTLRTSIAAATALFVIFSAILGLSSPDARGAVAEWLGLPGISIIREEAAEEAAPLAEDFDLGEKKTLRQARTLAGPDSPVMMPRGMGEPDEIYVEMPYGGFRTLAYRSRPGLPPLGNTDIGLLFTQIPGDIEGSYFSKNVPDDTNLEEVKVNGGKAIWIPAPHNVSINGERRRTDNVLLWEKNGQTLRLEADVPKDEALEIARSVR